MKIKKMVMIVFLAIITSCKSQKSVSNTQKMSYLPNVIVYKTRADYFDFVPVTFSSDKKEIISYPAPSDLKNGIGLTHPTKLKNGYLLDNRGISENSVFTTITYLEYSKLAQAPSLNYFYAHIKDKEPFLEIFNVGKRNLFKNLENDINKLIEANELKKYSLKNKKP